MEMIVSIRRISDSRPNIRFLACLDGSWLTCRRWDFHSRGVDSCRADVSLVIEFLLENLIYVAKLNISKRLKTFELFVDYVRVLSIVS